MNGLEEFRKVLLLKAKNQSDKCKQVEQELRPLEVFYASSGVHVTIFADGDVYVSTPGDIHVLQVRTVVREGTERALPDLEV